MKLRIRHLQLAVLAAALTLATIPVAVRFGRWRQTCVVMADLSRRYARMHVEKSALPRSLLLELNNRLDDARRRLDPLDARGDSPRAAKKAPTSERTGEILRITEEFQGVIDFNEECAAYFEDKACQFERARWLPWLKPTSPEDDPNYPYSKLPLLPGPAPK